MVANSLTIQQYTHRIRRSIVSYLFESSSSMYIRRVKPSDAAQLLRLFSTLEQETAYMLFSPKDKAVSIQEQKHKNHLFAMSDQHVMFVAKCNQRLVGFIRGTHEKNNKHQRSLHLVIGVVKAEWNRGIGSTLMHTLELWARLKDYHYLELSVMDINQAGIALYKKCGFRHDGIVDEPIIVEERAVQEVHMSKCLYATTHQYQQKPHHVNVVHAARYASHAHSYTK